MNVSRIAHYAKYPGFKELKSVKYIVFNLIYKRAHYFYPRLKTRLHRTDNVSLKYSSKKLHI